MFVSFFSFSVNAHTRLRQFKLFFFLSTVSIFNMYYIDVNDIIWGVAEFSQAEFKNSAIDSILYIAHLYIYHCVLIKILLIILVPKQNCGTLYTSNSASQSKFCLEFCRFYTRISPEFWFSNRIVAHYIYLSLHLNQNSTYNFVFPAELCQNFVSFRELCLTNPHPQHRFCIYTRI